MTITEINVFEDMFCHFTGNLLITDTKEFIMFPRSRETTKKIKTSPEIKKEDIFEGEIFDFTNVGL